MSYTLYMANSDKNRGVNLATMDWLRKLVAKHPEVKGSQFIRTFNCASAHGLHMSPWHCLVTAKVLCMVVIRDTLVAAREVGWSDPNMVELSESVLRFVEWFTEAAQQGGCTIWG